MLIPTMLDLLIQGGIVIDGTGGDARQADVAIREDRIIDVQPHISQENASHVLPAHGKIVCPGFIDVHSHSDAYILLEPSAPSKLFQGITTEVIGNCGASAAPHHGESRLPSDWESFHYPGCWNSMAEYRQLVEAASPAVNIVALVGHNILRAGTVGYSGRSATSQEIACMAGILEASLEAGARGMSTGLIYPPGMYAKDDEIISLASVVARHDGIYTSHMRSEGRHLLDSLRETVHVGQKTGVRVQVSHLKTSGRANWSLLDQAIGIVEAAQHDGVKVAADRYPYTASCTELDVILPHWATEGGREAELARLGNRETRARIREEILQARDAQSWETIIIGSSTFQSGRFKGVPLVHTATELGMEPVDAALHLILSDNLATTAFFQAMSEENMWRILGLPWVMIGSDASLRAPSGPLSSDFPHPRAYGAFTRFLRSSIDGRTVPLTEAVRKMTSLPASQFGLRDRGVIRCGAMADLITIDPSRLKTDSTYQSPHRLSEGISDVVVNGIMEVENGILTSRRGGKWL